MPSALRQGAAVQFFLRRLLPLANNNSGKLFSYHPAGHE